MTSSASSKSPAFDTVLDDAILPVLNLAKTCVTGIGIPGVEALINSVLELATMISVGEFTPSYAAHVQSHMTDYDNKQG
jgi:hypothetical protein